MGPPPPPLDPTALARRARTFAPWTVDHLVSVVLANAFGLLMVFAGWYEASGVSKVGAAIGWLDLSIGGLLVAGVANGIWLLRGRQAVMLARVSVLPGPFLIHGTGTEQPSANGREELVAGPRM